MDQHEIPGASDGESSEEAKSKKSKKIVNAVLIGFMIGVIVYSIAKNSVGIFTLIPLIIAFKLFNDSKKTKP
jgi:uncharacterized protein YqhQ